MKSLVCAALMATSTLIGTAAYAEDNPWMIRGRVLAVMPDESADLRFWRICYMSFKDLENNLSIQQQRLLPSK